MTRYAWSGDSLPPVTIASGGIGLRLDAPHSFACPDRSIASCGHALKRGAPYGCSPFLLDGLEPVLTLTRLRGQPLHGLRDPEFLDRSDDGGELGGIGLHQPRLLDLLQQPRPLAIGQLLATLVEPLFVRLKLRPFLLDTPCHTTCLF